MKKTENNKKKGYNKKNIKRKYKCHPIKSKTSSVQYRKKKTCVNELKVKSKAKKDTPYEGAK